MCMKDLYCEEDEETDSMILFICWMRSSKLTSTTLFMETDKRVTAEGAEGEKTDVCCGWSVKFSHGYV